MQGNANDFSPEELGSFQNGVDFQVVSGSIKLDPAFGFADGTYQLSHARIVASGPNNFELILDFIRRKGALSYRHQEKLALLYDGERLWFKRNGQIFRYHRPSAPRPANHRREQSCGELPVVLDDLKLLVKFD